MTVQVLFQFLFGPMAADFQSLMGVVKTDDLIGSLWLLLQGMVGIFIVMVVIFLVIFLLRKFTSSKKKKE